MGADPFRPVRYRDVCAQVSGLILEFRLRLLPDSLGRRRIKGELRGGGIGFDEPDGAVFVVLDESLVGGVIHLPCQDDL